VRVGASVAIVGLGGVGLAALIGAQAAGARQIIAVDLSDQKLEQAKALGATHCVNAAQPDAGEQIRSLSNGGVEFAFEFAGSIRALELAYRVTRRGGSTVTAGLPPSTALLPIPAVSLVAEERTLKGSYIGTCVPSRDIPHYMDLYMQGRLPVDKLLSGRLALDDINRGFDLLHEGKAIRQVVVFD
jgi:alcohol dehydrogenase